jgi:hypothetical protein
MEYVQVPNSQPVSVFTDLEYRSGMQFAFHMGNTTQTLFLINFFRFPKMPQSCKDKYYCNRKERCIVTFHKQRYMFDIATAADAAAADYYYPLHPVQCSTFD